MSLPGAELVELSNRPNVFSFPQTQNADCAMDLRLDPTNEQRPRTLACARPKTRFGTFELVDNIHMVD